MTDAVCRVCRATAGQRFVGAEKRLGWGQSLYRCGHCGNGYLWPDLAPERLAAFYRTDYRTLFSFEAATRYDAGFVNALRLRQIARCRLAQVRADLPEAPRVLDVGSGFGAFLAETHAAFPAADLHAVEPDAAHRTIATAGAPTVFHDTLDTVPAALRFDLIALFHTLEHVPDPEAMLRGLRDRLAPGGRLLVEVPDCRAPWTGWSNVHPAHLSYFTGPGLDRLLARSGLAADGPRHLLPDVLWRKLRAAEPAPLSPAPPPLAPPEEIAAFDALLATVGWTRGQALRKSLRRLAVALLGPGRVGALQRRRLGPTLDDALARALAPDGADARVRLLGASVDCLDFAACRALALAALRRERPPLRIGDVNTAKLMQVRDDPDLHYALAGCGLLCADGMGVVWAGRALGIAVPERVTGIDLMQAVLADCAANGWRPYLLGAEAPVLAEAVARLRQRFPTLEIAGSRHGYFSCAEEAGIAAAVRASGADCLIVGMGSPRQELFLERHFAAAGVALAMGVGGSFDVLAGRFRRAPRWMQRAGMEWLARLAQDPRRLFRRYLTSNGRLLALLAAAKLARLLRRG